MPGGSRRLLTPEQDAWVAERYPDATNAELVKMVEDEFGVSLTKQQISNFGTKRGLRKTEEAMRRTRSACARHVYTDEMREFMREYVPGHVYPQTADEFERRFGWRIGRRQYKNLCHQLGVRSGVHDYGRFRPGQEPPNKGKKWDEFLSPETQRRIRESGGMFEKGHKPASAYHELLDTTVNHDGMTLIYVRPRNAKNSTRLWIPYSHFVWMQHHGRDFPEGCRCVHCDHDKTNDNIENLMAVPNDVYGFVTNNKHGRALEYWDRQSLKVAIVHAKMEMTANDLARRRPRKCEVCGTTFVPEGSRRRYGERVRVCEACAAQGKRAPARRRKKGKEGKK